MSTRTVKIYSTLGAGGSIETNAVTLGDLLPILGEREINTSGMKLLVGETKNELSMPESVLPEGDFKLYLVPSKTKSGGVDLEEMAEQVEAIEDTVEDIHEKVNKILSLLQNGGCSNSGVKTGSASTYSREDEEAMRELNSLANYNG